MLRKEREWSVAGYAPVLLCLLAVWLQGSGVFAQTAGGGPKLETGKDIFLAACVSCHGPDGKGADRAQVGFDTPLPDFTDCNFTAREPDSDWSSIIHNGGPARGFSEIMPSFREALTTGQIDKVVGYLRSFCAEPTWPRGDLNLPRALVTEKAYPEDEAVLTTAINAQDTPAISHKIVYEKRFGVGNQIEVAAPFSFERKENGNWAGGAGDLTLGYKRLLFHNLQSGSIFSIGAEANLPTGDQARGFGKGVTVFESFLSYGQLLPSDSFFQLQGGVEVPTHRDDASKAAFWRAAVGKTFTQGGGFGRAWTPMVELLADRDFQTGAKTNWDVLPQFQVTLSKRQHIMANFGVRIPVNNTAGRPVQMMFYVLWDWFDGGLREGW